MSDSQSLPVVVAGQPRGLESVLCPDLECLVGLSVLALMTGRLVEETSLGAAMQRAMDRLSVVFVAQGTGVAGNTAECCSREFEGDGVDGDGVDGATSTDEETGMDWETTSPCETNAPSWSGAVRTSVTGSGLRWMSSG